MEKFKDYLASNNMRKPLTRESITSYVSYLARVPKLLGVDSTKFFKIKSPQELTVIMVKLKSSVEFKAISKKSQNNTLVAFRSYIASLKPKSFSSYVSYLKRAPIILGIDSIAFFQIDSPKRLITIMEKLKIQTEFKAINKKSQGNILTAFRRYIESIENLKNLKILSKRYLDDLNRSYLNFLKIPSDRKKATKLLVKKLSNFLERNNSNVNWDKELCDYLRLRNKGEANSIFKVSQNLRSKKYQEMVAKELEMTAKVIALQSHIEILGKTIN